MVVTSHYLKAYRKKRWKAGLCVRCGQPKESIFIQCDSCRSKVNERLRKWNHVQKEAVYHHYGNKCGCCGINQIEMLTIDHINNDGYNYRQAGYTWYHRIIKEGYPPTVQLLCWNCNMSKSFNKGICAHKLHKDNACI